MRNEWRLHGIRESYGVARHIGPPRKGHAPQGAFPDELSIERWLKDPSTRPALLEMLESVAGRPDPPAPRLHGYDSHRYIKERLLGAFERGDLVISRLAHWSDVPVAEPAAAATPPEEQRPAPRQTPTKTWIEIELVDQDGDPVAGARYLLTLPDGSTKAGTTGSSGRAMVKDIAPGACKVSFPDFDAGEWDEA